MKGKRTIRTRHAAEQDSPALVELVRELGYECSLEQMQDNLRRILRSRATDLLIVAESEEFGVCGFLQAHAAAVLESGFRVEILGLLVAKRARRLGIASKLVAGAEQWARGVGAKVLVVRSNETRVESHIFYPKLGFSVAKKQVVYRKRL